MTIPVWPRSIPSTSASYPKWPTGLVSTGQSGIVQTRATQQVGRSWEETYIPLKPTSDPIARGFLATVNNYWRNQTRFLISHPSQAQLMGGVPLNNDTGTVFGPSQSGALLYTHHWPPSETVLRNGDIFTIAGLPLVYDVVADAVTDSLGQCYVGINPPIYAGGSPASEALLTTDATPGSVLYTCYVASVSMPEAAADDWYIGCKVTFRETAGG